MSGIETNKLKNLTIGSFFRRMKLGSYKNQMQPLPNLKEPICACATPIGTAALAVVRISGAGTFAIANKALRKTIVDLELPSKRSVHFCELVDTKGDVFEQAVVLFFKGPHSYTGQDTVEFSIHGNPRTVETLLQILVFHGARLATAGEFTLRAFWNGKLSLEQAEGVGAFIQAQELTEQRLALGLLRGELKKNVDNIREKLKQLLALIELSLDFSEEDVPIVDVDKLEHNLTEIRQWTRKLIEQYVQTRRGKAQITIALMGPVNAGKSSLLNKLLLEDRAIVSSVPGTTRDLVDGEWNIQGKRVRIVDTAGLRKTSGSIEKEGIRRSKAISATADLILFLVPIEALSLQTAAGLIWIDKSSEQDHKELQTKYENRVWLVVNKVDKLEKNRITKLRNYDNIMFISAKYGQGMDELRKQLESWVLSQSQYGRPELTFLVNERHYHHLKNVERFITTASRLVKQKGDSMEFVAFEVRSALDALGCLTGEQVDESVLHHIFNQFCIGK